MDDFAPSTSSSSSQKLTFDRIPHVDLSATESLPNARIVIDLESESRSGTDNESLDLPKVDPVYHSPITTSERVDAVSYSPPRSPTDDTLRDSQPLEPVAHSSLSTSEQACLPPNNSGKDEPYEPGFVRNYAMDTAQTEQVTPDSVHLTKR